MYHVAVTPDEWHFTCYPGNVEPIPKKSCKYEHGEDGCRYYKPAAWKGWSEGKSDEKGIGTPYETSIKTCR